LKDKQTHVITQNLFYYYSGLSLNFITKRFFDYDKSVPCDHVLKSIFSRLKSYYRKMEL